MKLSEYDNMLKIFGITIHGNNNKTRHNSVDLRKIICIPVSLLFIWCCLQGVKELQQRDGNENFGTYRWHIGKDG